ncbi:hypothetical protein [Massilia varians]|uniref:hypothetical protein n=1 Tax=Massilia varians TaxID=457921 RepID=UPI002492587F|nr:hypothetical protein [Massilia varians]
MPTPKPEPVSGFFSPFYREIWPENKLVETLCAHRIAPGRSATIGYGGSPAQADNLFDHFFSGSTK